MKSCSSSGSRRTATMDSHSPTEPQRLTRTTYLPAALTLASGSLTSTVRGRVGQTVGSLLLAGALILGMLVSPGWGWAMIGLPLVTAAVIVPTVSLWIPFWNALRPNRRAWVGAGGRSFVTARLAPPNFYPDNASARRVGRGEATKLLDSIFRWADEHEQTAHFTATNMRVAQIYRTRYGAVTTGVSWGRPRMIRLPQGEASRGRTPVDNPPTW